MKNIESKVKQEVKRMTRHEILGKAIRGELKWIEAADILRVLPRQMLRLRERYEKFGIEGMRDKRTARRMPSRIPKDEVEKLCRLKRDVYADFTTKHFHRFAVAKHGVKMSYTWALTILQSRGLVTPERSRGTYRRRRERRAMFGMMLHQDGSRHSWVAGLPMQDLVVTLDDATGRILRAKFLEQEGTTSTFDGIRFVLKKLGRFSEFYTDRGSHYCHTSVAGEGPDSEQDGQLARVLEALGIRHIRERSAQPESAFTPMVGLDIDLLLSVQHERVVRNDNTVMFERPELQLPSTPERFHFARCRVVVHEFLDETIGISFQGRLLARFNRDGAIVESRENRKRSKQKAG